MGRERPTAGPGLFYHICGVGSALCQCYPDPVAGPKRFHGSKPLESPSSLGTFLSWLPQGWEIVRLFIQLTVSSTSKLHGKNKLPRIQLFLKLWTLFSNSPSVPIWLFQPFSSAPLTILANHPSCILSDIDCKLSSHRLHRTWDALPRFLSRTHISFPKSLQNNI